MKNSLSLALLCGWLAACCTTPPPCAPPVPCCHQYQTPGYDWGTIRRILLMPLENESEYPQGTFDVRDSLAARLQCCGRFEVVLAAPVGHVSCYDSVRVNGRFDEAELLGLAAHYRADAILFGTITQYRPYAPPKLGLSLRLISPGDASLIASADGLWDAKDRSIADQARGYGSMMISNGISLSGCELVLESPALYRQFACHQAVEALVSPVLTSPLSAPGPWNAAPMNGPQFAPYGTPVDSGPQFPPGQSAPTLAPPVPPPVLPPDPLAPPALPPAEDSPPQEGSAAPPEPAPPIPAPSPDPPAAAPDEDPVPTIEPVP